MKHNRRLNTVALALIILVISAVGMLTAPASASTTTYTGSGNPRSILERANNATSGSISANNTALTVGLPTPGTWSGYQMGTTFTNIARNADFVANGQFTGSPNPPWLYSEAGDTNYISYGFNASGSDYIRLQGKETVQRPLSNNNFTNDISGWTSSYSRSGYINTPTFQRVSTNGGEFQELGTYTNSFGGTRTGNAYLYFDQNFSYTGSGLPDFASLNYRFYISNWQQMGSGSMTVKLVLTRYPGGRQDFDIFSYPASGTTTKPGITSVNITSYLTTNGLYRIRLFANISLSTTYPNTSTASVNWDDVGVYIRYGRFSSQSKAMWRQTFNFNQYAIADGKVTFKYYTNLTTIVPSINSYISVWANGTSLNNRYDILPFSSVTVGSWGTLSLPIPYTVLNQSSPLSTISLGVGVYIGTNLQINSTGSPRFYFDNVTFYIKYKPTPAFLKLGIYDDANHQRWNDTETSYGSGALTVTPTLPRATLWTGSSATFHVVYNGTNGKAGYNLTSTTFNYAPTLYSSRSTQTSYCIFTVHDDTRTAWYLNYSTPAYIGGSQNYNTSIYIPADWLSGGLVSQVKFGGLVVTNYATASVNSSTWVIKIPASVFSPNPPRFLLEISASSPNYVGPSSLRTLLFTQGNTTDDPGPNNWINATSFVPKNITRLVCRIRNGSNGIPLNVASFNATIRLYNASSGKPTSSVWIVYPDSSGFLNVTLKPWADKNVTYFDGTKLKATLWYFSINWTNRYETANGIAAFTTNSTLSRLISTTLTSPGQPYTATHFKDFTLIASYKDARDGSYIGSPSSPATVTYKWNGTTDGGSMLIISGSNHSYSATISGSAAYLNHYAPQGTWIQINASKSGYVPQSIMVRVVVRDELTSGNAPPFPVPYANYAWNSTIMTSLTYLDVDSGSSGIVGANLYLNCTQYPGYRDNKTNNKIGSSGMVWWYKDLNNGTYRISIKGNATSIGMSTWSFTVKANKTYYSTVTFGLNGFNIRDRLTTYTYSSLSVTTPWNVNATFMITFRDLDATGTPPIYGAIPSCTWRTGIPNKDYFVTQLSNGTYRFILNVTGLTPGTGSCSFGFSKTHWTTITGISAQVTIRKILTSLSSPNTQINTFWGDNTTTVLTYLDLDHDRTISFASWDSVQVYNQQTGSNYSSVFASLYNIYFNSTTNSWMMRANGSLPVGNYALWIHAYVNTANGFYLDQWLYPTLNVNAISTNSAIKAGTVFNVVWGDNGTVILSYTDTVHMRPILGASVVVSIDTHVAWSTYGYGNGTYVVLLNVNGTAPEGPWPFTVTISELHYIASALSGTLQISIISTSLTVLTPQQAVAYGDQLTFTVLFYDLNHSKGIYSSVLVPVVCNWTIDGSLNRLWDPPAANNGTYTFNLDSKLRGQGLFLIKVYVFFEHYQVATAYYSFIIGVVNTTLTRHGTPTPTPWGDDAIVSLDYDVNGTTTWITGATITTNWTLTYTYLLTATGQWQITLKTTDLPEGIYWITINASKQHYQSHTLSESFTIRRISTSVTVSTTAYTIPWGDNATDSLTCIDTDHSLYLTGMSITSNWTHGLWVTMGSQGQYTLTLGTRGAIEGTYLVVINASKLHYATPIRTITFTVDLIATSVTVSTSAFTGPWGDNATIGLTYSDIDHSLGISGMSITSNWTHGLWLTMVSRGQYSLTLGSANVTTEGTYQVVISGSLLHYSTQIKTITFTVRAIATQCQLSSPSGLDVIKGVPVVITITYTDTDHSLGVNGALPSTIQGLEGVDRTHYKLEELGNGQYRLTLDTDWIPDNQLPRTFNLTIVFGKDHYSAQTRPVSFRIVPPGISPLMIALVGGGSGGVVILAMLAFVMYRRRKIPFVIKKIDQSIDLISKGEVPQVVPMRTRTQLIDGIYHAKLAILSKEKLEEPGKKKEKGAKKPEVASEMETRETVSVTREEVSAKEARQVEPKTNEATAGTETEEADVALIAEELEKLETKSGAESIRETDLIKREMEELEKESKKKKKKSN